MEHASAVVEYWDQPPPIKLTYRTPAGRAIGVFHTPAFFCLTRRRGQLGRMEARGRPAALSGTPAPALLPHRRGHVALPARRSVCPRLGVVVSAALIRCDELGLPAEHALSGRLSRVEPASRAPVDETVQRLVAAQPGMTLQALLRHAAASADAIYDLIATGRLYVDLDAVPLAEPARVTLFPDRDMALAYAHVQETRSPWAAHGIDLTCGMTVSWDRRVWTVVHVGETTVGLLGPGSAWTEIPLSVCDMLVRQGNFTGCVPEPTQAQLTIKERLSSARAHRGARGQSSLRDHSPLPA